MNDLNTIILAAGKGTRFRSEMPKVLHSLAGRPVIDYVIDVARAAGSLKIYVVAGHKAEKVASVVKGRAVMVLQKEQLGTAHAVRMCARHLGGKKGSVLVMCGDTPLLDKGIIRRLVAKQRRAKSACTVLSAVVVHPHGYGRMVRDVRGRLAAIREEKDASADEKKICEINTGVYCFDNQALFAMIDKVKKNPKKKEFYLTDIIALLIGSGRKVEVMATDDWQANIGINDRKDLAQAEEALRRKTLERFMHNGVTVTDPATTYIEQGVRIGMDTVLYPCTYIHHGVIVGRGCSIGPFARLRPGTVLADGVTVGNFTEVSRSHLGAGVTMKHFSFLGDANVGAGANIGCGAVTANYDGKNKNRTMIGPGAFIGSDAVLIAPVEVGKGAMVGAGAVVTPKRSVPSYSVAVGMPARVVRKLK
jgi:bifunctional UDP-N-acetylglucosamine pyrophosphorylase/glucosamine-1-phosphate N-acetyltransferase